MFCGSSNWLSCVSPIPFAARSVQSAGLHARSVPGEQTHSCGPEVVFRAAYSLPASTAIRGKALSDGSRSCVFFVVKEAFAAYAASIGVEVVQSGGTPLIGGWGSLVLEWTTPPLFAR